MLKLLIYSALMGLLPLRTLQAQTLYVDAVNGTDSALGTLTAPVASIDKAVALAHELTGEKPVTVKVYPGLYSLQHLIDIRTQQPDKASTFTIEAAIMPDDTNWNPSQMPVIQSLSANNSTVQFPHAVGFLVNQNNVVVRGLKFIGNANPAVPYYYPISRKNEALTGLTVSQCYFIGDKNASPIQGALWAHGGGTQVDHCIFYGCKNALLLFKAIHHFSLTYSIIAGAYEAAVWFGANDPDFQFSHNLVTDCEYVWLRPENTSPAYTFKQSVMAGNKHYMGFFGSKGAVEAADPNLVEQSVAKSGTIRLNEVKTRGVPIDYLNPLPESEGYSLKAGIFKRSRP